MIIKKESHNNKDCMHLYFKATGYVYVRKNHYFLLCKNTKASHIMGDKDDIWGEFHLEPGHFTLRGEM